MTAVCSFVFGLGECIYSVIIFTRYTWELKSYQTQNFPPKLSPNSSRSVLFFFVTPVPNFSAHLLSHVAFLLQSHSDVAAVQQGHPYQHHHLYINLFRPHTGRPQAHTPKNPTTHSY